MRLTVDNLTYYNPTTLNLLLRGNSLVTKAKSALSISGNEIIYNPTSAEKTALGDGVVYVQLKTDSMQTELVKITSLDLDGTIMKPFALAYTPLKNSDAYDNVDMLDTCRGLDRGLYYFKATCTNRPTSTSGRGYACIVNRRASGTGEYIQLIATDNTTGQTYTNTFNTTAWAGWESLNADAFVKKSGDTMTDSLTIQKASEAGVKVKNTTEDQQIDLIVNSSGSAKGLYDRTNTKWIIYSNASGSVYYAPGIMQNAGLAWMSVRNTTASYAHAIDLGVNATGTAGVYDRTHDKYLILSDVNGNVQIPQTLSTNLTTAAQYRSVSPVVKGTNPESTIERGLYVFESSGFDTKNRIGQVGFLVNTTGYAQAILRAYKPEANSTYWADLYCHMRDNGNPAWNCRYNNAGSTVSLPIQPPVGTVVCMSSNTAPSYYGTWELIDKEFKLAQTDKLSSITLNTTNVTSLGHAYTTWSGHTITISLETLTTKVALADSDVQLMTLTPANFGVTRFGYAASWFTFFSDGGDALLSFTVSTAGVLTSKDGFKIAAGSSTAHSVPAGSLGPFQLTFQFANHSYMNDSYCDKFYFKRTA